jgi:hypothetical protein
MTSGCGKTQRVCPVWPDRTAKDVLFIVREIGVFPPEQWNDVRIRRYGDPTGQMTLPSNNAALATLVDPPG